MNTRKLPDAILARLKVLWPTGLSASQCAARLNAECGTSYTRNAVIGMVYRHIAPRLTHQHKMNRAKISEEKLQKIAARNVSVQARAEAKSNMILLDPVPFIDRKPHQCPFPLWANDATTGGPDFQVCGAHRDVLEPYCKGHMKVTHNVKRASADEKSEAALALKKSHLGRMFA